MRRKDTQVKSYDREWKRPALRCSICTGERVAGFVDARTKRFEEVMLVRDDADLREFCRMYGIVEEIQKIY